MKHLKVIVLVLLIAGSVRGVSRKADSSDVTWIKFDEFSQLSTKAQRARLRNLVIELRAWKTANATIVAYGGKESCVNEALIRALRVRQFLVNVGGVKPHRIKILDAGYQPEWRISLYIAPADAPISRESLSYERPLNPSEVKIRRGCRMSNGRNG